LQQVFYDDFLHPGKQERLISRVIRIISVAVLLYYAFGALTENLVTSWNRHHEVSI